MTMENFEKHMENLDVVSEQQASVLVCVCARWGACLSAGINVDLCHLYSARRVCAGSLIVLKGLATMEQSLQMRYHLSQRRSRPCGSVSCAPRTSASFCFQHSSHDAGRARGRPYEAGATVCVCSRGSDRAAVLCVRRWPKRMASSCRCPACRSGISVIPLRAR